MKKVLTNVWFRVPLEKAVKKKIIFLSEVAYNYCSEVDGFSKKQDQYGRWILSLNEMTNISPVSDLCAKNPNTNEYEFASIIRENKEFDVDNPGVDAIIATVSADYAPGSIDFKLPGLTGLTIQNIEHLYGNPIENVVKNGLFQYSNVIFPNVIEVNYSELKELIEAQNKKSKNEKIYLLNSIETEKLVKKYGATSKELCLIDNRKIHPFYNK